jgi:hypothetical protein
VSLEETLNEQTRRKQETELANVLIGIVIFFILCHSPRIFLSVHEIIAYNAGCIGTDKKYYFTVVGAITQDFLILMLTINSSFNNIIYYFLTSNSWKDCFGCK